jgi:hypothetical protein
MRDSFNFEVTDHSSTAAPQNFVTETLKRACKSGDIAKVNAILVDRCVDPSVDDNYPIQKVCKFGHVDIVDVLLRDARVDSSVEDDNLTI